MSGGYVHEPFEFDIISVTALPTGWRILFDNTPDTMSYTPTFGFIPIIALGIRRDHTVVPLTIEGRTIWDEKSSNEIGICAPGTDFPAEYESRKEFMELHMVTWAMKNGYIEKIKKSDIEKIKKSDGDVV